MVKQHIRSIPDFPKRGILFCDISTLLAHAGAWRSCVDQLTAHVKPLRADLLVGIRSRGFLTAAPLALELGCGFAMIRKKGKLPGPTISHTHDLGIRQRHDRNPGRRDRTGTAYRHYGRPSGDRRYRFCRCRTHFRGNVGGAVAGYEVAIVELSFLPGRSRLEALDIPASTLVTFDK